MLFKNRIAEIDALKKEIDTYRLSSEALAKEEPIPQPCIPMLKEYFRIGLTYSSNALEGNTLTETETKVIIEDGLTIGGKTLREHFEVIGHSQAYDFMWQKTQDQSIFEQDILELHRLFYYRIDEENAGVYRKVSVIVTGTDFEFPKPSALFVLMKDFGQEINHARQTMHPVDFAAFLHVRLVTIHPFVDGNGRTARLLMNMALLQSGYPVTIIPPLMRSHYITALRQSNRGNNKPFFEFISEMVYESSKEYVRLLRMCCAQ